MSHRLADFAASSTLRSLSGAERRHLDDAFVNWLACAVAGADHPTVAAAITGLSELGSEGAFMPIGMDRRVSLVDVAVLDCLSSAVLAYDDIHFATGLHPTGPVAAALLALARRSPLRGEHLLEALHVGMEVQCRIATAYTSPGAGGKLGWYATGIAGGIGAAAGVCRVLGMDAGAIANAMAIAAARACGNRGTHGAMTAAYVPSTAAASGLTAAFLTRGGMTCRSAALDGTNGLLELICERPDHEAALAGLGTVSIAAQTAFKPYPSGFVTHAAIDACLLLRARLGDAAADLEKLTIHVSPAANALGANAQPVSLPEAQVSIAHWAALAVLEGRAGIAEADVEWISDPRVRSVRSKIVVKPDPGFANDQCLALVTATNGGAFEICVDHARGSPERPMSSQDVDEKVAALFGSKLQAQDAERLHRACRGIAKVEDVAAALAL